MNCPKDHSPLIIVEHDQIAIDYCPECRGVWLDHGELELIMEKACGENAEACMNGLFHRQEAVTSEPKRRCPICHSNMRKERLGTEPEVIIDACSSRDDGLWFDGGELHQVMSHLTDSTKDTDNKMLSFLKEILEADATG